MRLIAPTLLSALALMITSGTAGAAWSLQEPPVPGGFDGSWLFDFSCDREPPTTDACTAVGESFDDDGSTPLVARWEESRWALQSAVIPRETVANRFEGISCPSETSCTAVGSSTTATNEVSLAERWNGTSWSVQRTVNPAEATVTKLNDVGCWTASTCTAVGHAIVRSAQLAIAERWDGSTWALQSIPLPERAEVSQFDAVTCRNSAFCVAVGSYTERGNAIGLGAFWNGTTWSAPAIARPEGATATLLLGVSCLESGSCIAVGFSAEAGGRTRTLTLVGDGSSWTLVPSPNPTGASFSELHGVSCTIGSLCVATGRTSEPLGDTDTLALRWNGSEWGTGSEWQVEETPTPEGAVSNSLEAVVCDDETCMTAGSTLEAGGLVPLAARATFP